MKGGTQTDRQTRQASRKTRHGEMKEQREGGREENVKKQWKGGREGRSVTEGIYKRERERESKIGTGR